VETASDTESRVALVTAPLGPPRTIADRPRRFSRGPTRCAPPEQLHPEPSQGYALGEGLPDRPRPWRLATLRPLYSHFSAVELSRAFAIGVATVVYSLLQKHRAPTKAEARARRLRSQQVGQRIGSVMVPICRHSLPQGYHPNLSLA